MRCLVLRDQIDNYKHELLGTIQSKQDIIQALNTIARNTNRINKEDIRIMLNIIVKEIRECVL